MKIKRILFVAMAIIMLFVFAACNTVAFMSDSARNDLVKKYGTPKAQVVIEYTRDKSSTNGDEDEVVTLTLNYNLLLNKTPITVINFINLVEDGYYNEKTTDTGTTSLVFDNRISSNTNSWIVGRYNVTVDSKGTKTYRAQPALDYTILGEFVQNGYVLPKASDETDEEIKDGNAKFSMFSLAMYHEKSVSAFDQASSAFFLTTDSVSTENYKNFAVFAELTSISVSVNGEALVTDATQVPDSIVDDFDNILNETTSQTVVDDADGESSTSKVTMLKNVVRIVSIKMVDNNDYSSLPTNYVIR